MLSKYLSVTDNAIDAVILYVSASSERQGCEKESGQMKKGTKC